MGSIGFQPPPQPGVALRTQAFIRLHPWVSPLSCTQPPKRGAIRWPVRPPGQRRSIDWLIRLPLAAGRNRRSATRTRKSVAAIRTLPKVSNTPAPSPGCEGTSTAPPVARGLAIAERAPKSSSRAATIMGAGRRPDKAPLAAAASAAGTASEAVSSAAAIAPADSPATAGVSADGGLVSAAGPWTEFGARVRSGLGCCGAAAGVKARDELVFVMICTARRGGVGRGSVARAVASGLAERTAVGPRATGSPAAGTLLDVPAVWT